MLSFTSVRSVNYNFPFSFNHLVLRSHSTGCGIKSNA